MSKVLSLNTSAQSEGDRKLPLIKGAGRALEIIPIVLNVFETTKSKNKWLIRKALQDVFRKSFFEVKNGKMYTTVGRVVRTPEDLKTRLLWTWLDQYALPMCERLKLITRNDGYHLTPEGSLLVKSLKEGKFEDELARHLVSLDRDTWSILPTLNELGPATAAELEVELRKRKLLMIDGSYLNNFLLLFKTLRIIKQDGDKYSLEDERYGTLQEITRWKSFDEISDETFITALASVYRFKSRVGRSPYVLIEDLTTPTGSKLSWPAEYVVRKLEKVPLVVDGFQLLFSPAAHSRRGGVKRNGRYYSYLSMYDKQDE